MQQIEQFDKEFYKVLTQGNYGYVVDRTTGHEYRIVDEPSVNSYQDSEGETELHLIVIGRLYVTTAVAQVESEHGECFMAEIVVTQTRGSEVEKPWTYVAMVN